MQFDRQVAVYSSAFYDGTGIDDATFGLVVVPAPDVMLETIEADMDAVIADFLKTGPDPAALERIRMQVRAADIYDRDDIFALANRYGEGLTVGLSIKDIEGWDEALASVTEADVMAVAEKVFDRRNAVTGWLVQPGTEEEVVE